MSILAAASNSGDSDMANTAFLLVFVIAVGGLLAWAIIRGVDRWHGRTDVHEVTGTMQHQVSGTLRHEVDGTLRHQVEHSGTVRYEVEHTGGVEMRLAQEDRDRIDRLAAGQPRMVVPPPPPAVLSRDDRQPAIYRYAAEDPPPLPPGRESRVLDRRPTWPEIEQ